MGGCKSGFLRAMNTALRILLVGAQGRMGKAVAAAARKTADLTIVAGVDRDDPVDQAMDSCDVVVDFSAPAATKALCHLCMDKRRPLVIGTTGHTAAEQEFVAGAAQVVPIVFSANFSLGINALFALARHAGALLGQGFDVEIVETHHRTKKDAPSGTAKRLADILQAAREGDAKVTTHSVRAGDVVGDHQVIFAGNGERLELIHRASSRETFALGALRAALWVYRQPPGLYSMEDVLAVR